MAGLASLGGRGAFIGKVRDDQLGAIFRHDIRSLGIVFETAPAADGPSTARCLVLVTPDAQRTLQTYLGAAADLGPEDVDERLIAGARITYLEGYLWDRPPAKQAFVRAAEAAPLSVSDELAIPGTRSGSALFSLPSIGGSGRASAEAPFSIAPVPGGDGAATLRGTVSLFGSLGAVVEYASGLPRFRGLSFSPSETVRIEATGYVFERE